MSRGEDRGEGDGGEIRRLLAGLTSARVPFTADDLCDALWLAGRRGAGLESPAGPAGTPGPIDRGEAGAATDGGAATPPRPPRDAHLEPASGRAAGVFLPAGGLAAPGDTAPGQPVAIVGADPLPGTGSLIRALRPLMRRGPSRSRVEFDEDETVRRVAEELLWDPAQRPALDRWVRLSIVVDASRSMALWRTPAWAFARRLQGLGAFDAVQIWWWDTGATTPRLNRARRGGRVGPIAAPTSVARGAGRGRLVLVVSDGASEGWRSGEAPAWLARWARHAHVALVQPLPEAVWPVTSLGRAATVWLDVPTTLPPNTEIPFERSDAYLFLGRDRGRARLGPPIPVVSLDPGTGTGDAVGTGPLARWARAAAGDGLEPIPGVAWERPSAPTPTASPSPSPAGPVATTPLDTSARALDRFLRAATPPAVRLGRLLAAAPLITLPILRLLRANLVPGGRQSHEAEVLMAGWLAPATSDPTDVDPDLVRYTMAPEVRQRLLQALPTTAALDVLRTLGSHLGTHVAGLDSFPAMLDDPTGRPGAIIRSEDPIALVTADVLRHIGGAFARLVQVNRGPGPRPPGRRPPLRPEHRALWYFETLGIPELWDMGLTGEGIRIGYFLSFDAEHPLLRREPGTYTFPTGPLDPFAFVQGSSRSSPEDVEELRVSSVDGSIDIGTNAVILMVGQPNDSGLVLPAHGKLPRSHASGIAPRAVIVSGDISVVRVSDAQILSTAEWLLQQEPLHLINLDLGLETENRVLVDLVHRMERQIRGAVFCAAGNDGPGRAGSPASGEGIFSVGSFNEDAQVSEFSSSRGARTRGLSVPTLTAPGEGILNYATTSSQPPSWSGTTASTAILTGLAALLLEAVPEATVDQLKWALIHSCELPDTMTRERAGAGIPNGPRALELLRKEVDAANQRARGVTGNLEVGFFDTETGEEVDAASLRDPQPWWAEPTAPPDVPPAPRESHPGNASPPPQKAPARKREAAPAKSSGREAPASSGDGLDDALARALQAASTHKQRRHHKRQVAALTRAIDILSSRGQTDEVIRLLLEELAPAYEQLGDAPSRAAVMANAADLLAGRGRHDEALKIFREAIVEFTRLEDAPSRAGAQARAADSLAALGRHGEALKVFEEAIARFAWLGDFYSRAEAQARAADSLAALGRHDEALKLLQEAIIEFERLGDDIGRAGALARMADILAARGRVGEAFTIYDRDVVEAFRRRGDARGQAIALSRMAEMLAAAGRPAEALGIYIRRVLPTYEQAGDTAGRDRARQRIAELSHPGVLPPPGPSADPSPLNPAQFHLLRRIAEQSRGSRGMKPRPAERKDVQLLVERGLVRVETRGRGREEAFFITEAGKDDIRRGDDPDDKKPRGHMNF